MEIVDLDSGSALSNELGDKEAEKRR